MGLFVFKKSIPLIFTLIILFQNSLAQHNTTGLGDGEWNTSASWNSVPGYTNVNDDVNVNHYTYSNSSIVFRDGGSNKNSLTVSDTLIVYGSLTLGSFDDVTVGNDGVLIIFGDFTADNQVNVGNGGYFVVLGDYNLPTGGTSHTNTGDAKTFVTGTVTAPGSDLDCDPNSPPCEYGDGSDLFDDPIFEFIDEISGESCNVIVTANITDDSGVNDGAIDVTVTGATSPSYSWDNDAITQDISGLAAGDYSLVVFDGTCVVNTSFTVADNCCGSSNYYSYDNQTGNWEDISTWESPNDGWRPLPPPTDGSSTGFSQPLCIKGTIIRNGDLTIRNTTHTICDTLVITGNLDVGSFTMNIASNGVLIVLGDYTGTSGTSDNSGKVIIAGNIDEDYTLEGSGDTYIFDPTPSGNFNGGFTSAGDETDLENNDGDLFNFFQSVSGGTSVDGGVIGASQTICSGDDVAAFTDETSPSPAGTYKWFMSTNSADPFSGTWAEIAGATGLTYDYGTVTQTTFFYRETTSSGNTGNSNVLTITVNTLPTVTISATPSSICYGEFSDLSATGGTSYSWSPAGDLDNAAVATPRYTPPVNPTTPTQITTTFTVTVTDANSCVNTNTVDVVVNRLPETGPQYHIENSWGN